MYRLGKLSFDKKNFGIPYDTQIDVPCISWSYHVGRTKTYINAIYTFKKVKDNNRLEIRSGDIFKFGSRFGKLEGCFGVILERYKIVKEKPWEIYKDYGAVVLISTGKRKGEVYNVSPQMMGGLQK